MNRCKIVAVLLCGFVLYPGFWLTAAERDTEALIADLGSSEFKTRASAKRLLYELCKTQPAVLDALCQAAFDADADLEQVLNANEIIKSIVKEHLFVERGSIGISLDHDLKVRQLQPSAPAQEAGIKHHWQLTHVAGKAVEGMSPVEVYGFIHQTRPGEKLALIFKDELGNDVTVHPVVAPRSKIRADENVEIQRKTFYEEWLEAKRKDLQNAQ